MTDETEKPSKSFADFLSTDSSYKPKGSEQKTSEQFRSATTNPEIFEQQRLALEKAQKSLIKSTKRRTKNIPAPDYPTIDPDSVS